MSATDLGQKQTCFSCGVKFYDFNKPEKICPRCGSNQQEAPKSPDMSDIAAQVLASTVTDADEPGEGYGPVADEMEVFGSEDMPGDASSGASGGEEELPTEDDDSADDGFDDDDF